MFKLLAMLFIFLIVALALLGMRQRRLELTSESSSIYAQIRDRNETLLDQRVEIARQTNPKTLATALQNAGIDTGAALQSRQPIRRTLPVVETDLVAPLR